MKNLYVILFALFFGACVKEAQIKVTNKVHNCRIENITFDDYRVDGSAITNESTMVTEIRDKKKNWPKRAPLKFHMIAMGNRIVLKTHESYELKMGETLEITIDNNTGVGTP